MTYYIYKHDTIPTQAMNEASLANILFTEGTESETNEILDKLKLIKLPPAVNSKPDDTAIMMALKNSEGELYSEWLSLEDAQAVFNEAKAKAKVKRDRDLLLSNTDWTQLPDVPEEVKQKWTAYRQALRDITSQPGYPLDVQWPSTPK